MFDRRYSFISVFISSVLIAKGSGAPGSNLHHHRERHGLVVRRLRHCRQWSAPLWWNFGCQRRVVVLGKSHLGDSAGTAISVSLKSLSGVLVKSTQSTIQKFDNVVRVAALTLGGPKQYYRPYRRLGPRALATALGSLARLWPFCLCPLPGTCEALRHHEPPSTRTTRSIASDV